MDLSGVEHLYQIVPERTKSVSPENPTGEKGRGGMAIPRLDDPALPFAKAASRLGQGWKASPFIKPKAGETVTIMDVDGPGVIQHIWMATAVDWRENGRACILRFYWDHEEEPSVEVPMTDFFAVGHDLYAPVNSAVIAVNPASAMNCYWQMPFKRHARITFTNDGETDLPLLTYQITYVEKALPDNTACFHAQWRRAVTERSNPDYTILDHVAGQGKYIGTFLAWTQLSEGWFGEGEIKFYLDGDDRFPTICGTGTEDYFCGSYGFPDNFSNLYTGVHKHERKEGPIKWSLYRWHLPDPICFEKDLKVTIQALGWWPYGHYQPLQEDIASVAYWYQSEPHVRFPALPVLSLRWQR